MQAAEKLLKALLMVKNIPYRRTHDLRELIDLIRDNDIKFPESLMEIRTLSPFAVEFRYDYIPMEKSCSFQLTSLSTLKSNLLIPSPPLNPQGEILHATTI